MLECGEEKILTLTEVEQVKAVAAQLVKLLRAQKDNSLLLAELLPEYSRTFGYALRLHDFDVSSVPALMQKLCHVVKVTLGPGCYSLERGEGCVKEFSVSQDVAQYL